MKTLKDIIDYNLKILFIGINPSPISVKKGHFHQGKLGQRFWQRLGKYDILKINESLREKEDSFLLCQDFGITDLVKRPTKTSKELTNRDFSKGRELLRKKILKYRPKMLVFVYKKAAEKFIDAKISGFGKIEKRFSKSSIFLLPNPYASIAQEKKIMYELKELLNKLVSN